MRRLRFAVLVAAGLTFFAAAAAATTYEIDPVHSTLVFRAKRMGVVYVYGAFRDIAGTIEVPGDDLTKGRVSITVETASIDTGNERRDDHLRSPDFLNSAEIPLMSFESTEVKATGEGTLEVTGRLSLHGVTQEVTIPVEQVGAGKDPRSGAGLIGFDGRFTLKRSDFGMSFMQGPISDEIDIQIAIHGVAK